VVNIKSNKEKSGTLQSPVPYYFRDFPMIWNVAGVRDEISLRRWSGGTADLRTLVGALVAKNAFCWQQCFFFTHVSLHIA